MGAVRFECFFGASGETWRDTETSGKTTYLGHPHNMPHHALKHSLTHSTLTLFLLVVPSENSIINE